MIICVATHYEGDPCDNTKKFYKWLKEQVKTPENKIFSQVKFIILGLGDTSYEQFNAIGKYVNESLQELGGTRVYKYGETNAENNQAETNFIDWK